MAEDLMSTDSPPGMELVNPDIPSNTPQNSLNQEFSKKANTEIKDSNPLSETLQVNGENHLDSFFVPQEDSYSSESDALVIDEKSTKKKRNRVTTKKTKDVKLSEYTSDSSEIPSDFHKKTENEIGSERIKKVDENIVNNINPSTNDFLTEDPWAFCEAKVNKSSENRTDSENFGEMLSHSNPYFNESLFELSQMSQLPQLQTSHHLLQVAPPEQTSNQIARPDPQTMIKKSIQNVTASSANSTLKTLRKPKPAKGKDYARYLGLQPAVQFKCSKCGKSGFESLVTLQDHLIKCNAVAQAIRSNNVEKEKCSKFKLTRKVFLCSACGTYYENWNLYMHMLEFHKRYVCLYCLGMFSVLDDLFSHIETRHNVEPGIKNSLEEFYKTYKEACYVVCCECSKLFTEKDNFFSHKCVPLKSNKNKPKPVKLPIKPSQHVTGEDALTDQVSNSKIIDTVTEKVSNNSEVEKNYEKENVPQKIEKNDNKIQNSDQQSTMENKEDGKANIINETDNNLDQEINQSNESQEDNLEISSFCSKDQSVSIDDKAKDNQENTESMETEEVPTVETRKVPKLSLKIPKLGSYMEPEAEDSDYSDKMDINNDQDDLDSGNENELSPRISDEEKPQIPEASSDVAITELAELEPLDKIDIKVLLQKCLKATSSVCIYCNHSRRIAVNGKQLGLHVIAAHKYSAVVKSITAEELQPDRFVTRIKESLDELEAMYFNQDSNLSNEAVTFSHLYECFQCYYATNVHKELYLHNRKFHSKSLLLCIMCKSNFYSYSELICHLCPGTYVSDVDLQFRCCMCVSDDLPSSFRLMVHLRKMHNICDVCLEMCHTQFKLSTHVWKHKLNHFCYRCGIAYRNKQDITRHLFWKHGTQSIICKKCLQKKWPHMYHFCHPPAFFTCEECSLTCTKAVYLKVHKRLHTKEMKHQCTFEGCEEKFISKRLMMKHERRHWEPPEEEKPLESPKQELKIEEVKEEELPPPKQEEDVIELPKIPKPIVDPINCLPELNLSESDSSDSETDDNKRKTVRTSKVESTKEEMNIEEKLEQKINEIDQKMLQFSETLEDQTVIEESTQVISNIWENFKNYQESKSKLLGQDSLDKVESEIPEIDLQEELWTLEKALMEHDYCLPESKPEVVKDICLIEVKPVLNQADRADHDYCFSEKDDIDKDKVEENFEKTDDLYEETKNYWEKPPLTLLGGVAAVAQEPVLEDDDTKPVKGDSSSSSGSESDSTSCSCGSNCSCSSSSLGNASWDDSSNSDSSTEEGRKRQQQRRQKRMKQKEKSKLRKEQQKNATSPVKSVTKVEPVAPTQQQVDPPIAESDLETTESDTDEEFYDRQPQMFARKLMEEKRAMILAQMDPDMLNGSFFDIASRPPTPPAGTIEEESVRSSKKKKKNKKRKKKNSKKKRSVENKTYSATLIMPAENTSANSEILSFAEQRNQLGPTVAPITLSLSRNSVTTTKSPPMSHFISTKETYSSKPELPSFSRQDSDPNCRASKRKRVPNKFYGYSSDEEEKYNEVGPSAPKSRKMEAFTVTPSSLAPPKLVPPITIKATPSPSPASPKQLTVEPITLRLPKSLKTRGRSAHSNNNLSREPMKKPIPTIRLPTYLANRIPPEPSLPQPLMKQNDSDSDDNDLPSLGHRTPSQPPANLLQPQTPAEPSRYLQPQLYCYCRCPYDEVSEMIGCDSKDCAIEWFHFECVGIMVPPKGQWFCPDCRKKKQRRELVQAHAYQPSTS